MRVTMVNKYYPPHVGGVEDSLRRLSEALAARGGIDVSVIVANEGRELVRECANGVDLLRLPRALAYASTPLAPAMPRAIREATATADSLVHFHHPYPWGDWSIQASRTSAPLVVTYHADIVRQKRMLALYRPLLTRLLDRAARVIVGAPQIAENSPFLAPHLDKCRVVPFAIDLERYRATPTLEARAAEFRAGHTRPVVLFVGRLVYYKGVDVLVRAMAEVDADLVIVGKGPLESELREAAVARGIGDRISFLSMLPDDELRAWYHAADVFCLPSVAVTEAYGLVQLEAHASGLPVVSTDLPTGVPFVNRDGLTGLTVPPGDQAALARALQTLVTDEPLRRTLGEAARERAFRDFTVERMVDGTVQVYDEAMRGRR